MLNFFFYFQINLEKSFSLKDLFPVLNFIVKSLKKLKFNFEVQKANNKNILIFF